MSDCTDHELEFLFAPERALPPPWDDPPSAEYALLHEIEDTPGVLAFVLVGKPECLAGQRWYWLGDDPAEVIDWEDFLDRPEEQRLFHIEATCAIGGRIAAHLDAADGDESPLKAFLAELGLLPCWTGEGMLEAFRKNLRFKFLPVCGVEERTCLEGALVARWSPPANLRAKIEA